MSESPLPESGNTFACVRALYGLTQQEFAATFGIGLRTVQALEQGVAQPSRLVLMVYCLIAKAPEKVMACASEVSQQLKSVGGI